MTGRNIEARRLGSLGAEFDATLCLLCYGETVSAGECSDEADGVGDV